MGKYDKLFSDILSGRKDKSIRFNELAQLLHNLGFNERVKGDHHIFYRSDIEEILNIQPDGSSAKPYQVRQIRNIIVKYQLEALDE